MRRVLLASFGGIAAIVALGNVVGSWHARRARIETGEALANAFRSVDLVSEIGRNLARERLLIDTHIAEKEKLGMER
ncbi:MAG: hypothetical protein ACXVDD_04005, partial [Polyangia bacterium]